MYLCLLLIVLSADILQYTNPAPASSPQESSNRISKSLYYNYIPEEYSNYDLEVAEENFLADNNDLSRTLPSTHKSPTTVGYNSPIYYIRLPPQPYMFVPGLGYIPQPPSPPSSSPISHLVNLPVSFLANGRPSTIYQWNGALGEYPTAAITPPQQKPPKDSTVNRLPGQYSFNGKPEDIFVLRDSYNSLYGDALQNFYP